MKINTWVRPALLMLLVVGLPRICCSQNNNTAINSTYYYFIDTTSTVKITYTYVDGDPLTDYFLDKRLDTNGHRYYIRIRAFKNRNDTSFFRETTDNFVSLDRKTLTETIVMPKKPIVGQTWEGSDGNWIFVVKEIDAILETPTKNYTNLVNIEARQRTKAEKNKFEKYNNFYALGIGYVGSVVDGKLFSYRKKAKTLKSKDQ